MSRKVIIGGVTIGGGEKTAVQSMSTLKISDTGKAAEQARILKEAGCDILRFSVLDEADAKSFAELKKRVDIPLVADIHFDYRLAIKAIDGGADKIRINPVRVGSNTGSIEKEFLNKYGRNEISLGESALKNARCLEKYGVSDIVVSVKASDAPLTVKANKYIAERADYPLHIGVTEAGTEYNGVVKNAVAIGALLSEGIGDTIRVSLSADPVREVVAAKAILSALKLESYGAEVIACPTCGRCAWDCMGFAAKTEEYVKNVKKPIKIAVMGCVVNGPGEAADADIGVAGGKDGCVIFSGGRIIKKVREEDLEKEFFAEIDECLK